MYITLKTGNVWLTIGQEYSKKGLVVLWELNIDRMQKLSHKLITVSKLYMFGVCLWLCWQYKSYEILKQVNSSDPYWSFKIKQNFNLSERSMEQTASSPSKKKIQFLTKLQTLENLCNNQNTLFALPILSNKLI